MIKKAVIPAAGLGTRFLPATKAQPKEMLPIVDKPTIQYIIEEAVESGIEDIIIVTGRSKRAIEDHFDKSVELEMLLERTGKHEMLEVVENISNLVDIHYVRQKEPLGLGHAVLCAKKFIGNEPFAVLLGDDIVDSEVPALKQMIDQYTKVQSSILGCNEVPRSEVYKYGIVNYSENTGDLFKVKSLVEKPAVEEAPSTQAIVGRYILTPAIFDMLEDVQPDKKGEIQLTDAIDSLLDKESIYSYIIQGNRYDVGDKFGFLQASIDFALKRPDLKDKLSAYLKELNVK
ncbi:MULTISPECIES: UTP--glucose-1-phosphate uridylyltransferase GalU [Cytobacillus]|uniref:UTP--glucose-1-phosphate uridylyltransferase n=2 Tax=Cytobacillus TaxID=2675230 RepID=A0ABX3CKW5_9BACI|nr:MULTISPECIES: UTP--glucose-1-phosphate uridylyltransferase GalU [Cytobacillus]EFV78219.1 UTP-glucose-1-phosphate uridylyltransferase [Bacillus sp. 2_A_57_CT2]MCM3403674.1 UTP--glucose-1-phosphate uridylyltransferase GalU [Cytobacillus oceanisediminis]MDK7666820.1 UTP--glucose-1-phosphate uridylyltransferase GalU [Cytobacillus oceanisediminis]OHX41519.1 UTP--glucose-1-phosphate uridylyltransferase [Cytobacillus oceanisediminis]QOK25808.1 UTP--glucose-1-phosphate uridylyltransferase GalU [Cyt